MARDFFLTLGTSGTPGEVGVAGAVAVLWPLRWACGPSDLALLKIIPLKSHAKHINV